MSNARFALCTAGDSVKSTHSDIVWWEMASPAPRIHTGSFGRSFARSSETRTTAPPPSERMQQSSLCNGEQMTRELTTSSTVIGSRYMALGLRAAFCRICTAISARCSGRVPNSCMCRVAAMACRPMTVCP